MFYIDTQKLLGKMAETGFTKASFARALGINRNTLRKYFIDYNKIPYELILSMVRVLNCSREEALTIFFAKKLS